MSKLVVIIVCLVLIFVFVMLVLLPKYRDFRILKTQVLQKQAELDRREQYLSQLEFLDKKLEKYSQELEKIDNAIPKEPQLPSLFGFLQQVCAQNGLVFKEIKGFKTESLKNLKEIKQTIVKFKVAGTIENFLEFLDKAEKSARLIEVSTINFRLPEKGDVFVFEIEAKVYSKNQAQN